MNRFVPLIFFPVLACCIVAVAAFPARHSTDEHAPMLSTAPAKARSRMNPYKDQRDAILAGRKLFRQHCAECHGEDARGICRAPSLHSTEVRQATSGELEWFLRNGHLSAGMPSWSGLPPQRRWQIVAYLKSLR